MFWQLIEARLMIHSNFQSASFQIGCALALGMLGQVLSRLLRLPGIVVLLALGVAFGPEGAGVLRPSTLGHGLADLVGFAVAVILFEGGLALELRALWRHGLAIRRLVTLGIATTAILASLLARFVLEWSWTPSVLFGSLVVVTGPTVIQPLLRRIRVFPRVAVVLEAEGILGDAIGATLAVVTLEVLLASPGETLQSAAIGLFSRLAFGVLLGTFAGAAIMAALRFERLIPEELRNVTALSMLLGFYQASNALQPESGILTAIAAGLFVGNLKGQPLRRLKEFKEELTVLLIGLLFVLLAADVKLAEIQQLGLAGWCVVGLLVLVVRPLNVFLSTRGTDLPLREKLFLSWLAPRGIVAAAVASHFALVLGEAGEPGGRELQALVFLVIAVTVVVQGLSGGFVARLLGVSRPPASGWAILGANPLGRLLAQRLGTGGEVLLLDANPDACERARLEGYAAFCGNMLASDAFESAQLEDRRRFVAVTSNEEVNVLFARQVRETLRTAEIWVALRRDNPGIGSSQLEALRVKLLFGDKRNLELWSTRIDAGGVMVQTWYPPSEGLVLPLSGDGQVSSEVLPLVYRRGGKSAPIANDYRPLKGDEVDLAVSRHHARELEAELARLGWRPVPVVTPVS